MQKIDLKNIPKEKFAFAKREEAIHDKKLASKPVGYFQDAFRRFCKNKGSVVAACIILFLLLYAIIAPIFSPYTVSYNDALFSKTLPKCPLFEATSFWDGCSEKSLTFDSFSYYYAMGLENPDHEAVKDQKYTMETVTVIEQNKDGESVEKTVDYYNFRLDSYHMNGCIYKNVTLEEWQDLQAYQDETGRQVAFPTIAKKNRPAAFQDQNNANYYYKTTKKDGKTVAVLDDEGNVIPLYASVKKGAEALDAYTSKMRIDEPEDVTYRYALPNSTGYEIRVNYYEYYRYLHDRAGDKIDEPMFLFGTTASGQDIFTCLASGARFSFIFAIAVASINMFIGAIYGAIEGYYGGVADLVMERISDILSAVPFMIVITLLKLHMGGTSQMLILFIAFFITGWIGMASNVRMQFYRFKNHEYVFAARTLGASDSRIMIKHIFPNALGTLVTRSVLVIPSMIFSETSLSYLGIINLSTGDMTSVGTLLAGGNAYLTTFPHIAAFPSVYLALLMLSFNLFGNGLRDAFNPSLRGSED